MSLTSVSFPVPRRGKGVCEIEGAGEGVDFSELEERPPTHTLEDPAAAGVLLLCIVLSTLVSPSISKNGPSGKSVPLSFGLSLLSLRRSGRDCAQEVGGGGCREGRRGRGPEGKKVLRRRREEKDGSQMGGGRKRRKGW